MAKKKEYKGLRPYRGSNEDAVHMTSRSYDEAAEKFRDYYYPPDGSRRSRSVHLAVVAFVKHMAGKTGVILDLGCGPGVHSDFIRRMTGNPVVGVDLSRGMLRCARERNADVDLVMMDVRNLALRDSCCVGVWSSCMVHHIPRNEIPRLFGEMHRVSKPGGIVYVIMNSGTFEGVERDRLFSYGIEPRFISSLDATEAARSFESTGFEVLSVKESSDELIHLIARKPREGRV
jgi:ubiquinone/menaquinone biosynthesis C-methylase UbiE